MDFIVDGLANGRMVRILIVVDVFTRERVLAQVWTCLMTIDLGPGIYSPLRRALAPANSLAMDYIQMAEPVMSS